MIGLVLVSHSAALVDGLRDLLAQMADDVVVAVAGGDDDGGIGTSFDRITAAVEEADRGQGAVVLYDLGSAKLTTEMVLEMLDPERVARTRLVDAPLVEGALAAASTVTPQATLDDVVAAAEAAGVPSAPPADDARDRGDADLVGEGAVVRDVQLRNPLGLHARPAAAVTRAVRDLSADVRIRTADGADVDARSVLAMVGLGTTGGDPVTVVADGPDAEEAVARVAALVEEGFGEADDAASPGPQTTPTRPGAAASEDSPTTEGPPAPGTVLSGRTGAPGGGIGPATRLTAGEPELPAAPDGTPEQERTRLGEAVERARAALHEAAAGPGGDVFAAHAALLDDPALVAAAGEGIDADTGAARSWWATVVSQHDVLRAAPTEFLAARAVDVLDVGRRVLRELGVSWHDVQPAAGSVVVAADVTPTRVTALREAGVAALVTTGGSPTSHAAVIARSLGLPFVVGVEAALLAVEDGTTVLVDADAASVTVAPGPEVAATFRDRLAAAAQRRAEVQRSAHEPVVLADGRRLRVGANVASVADARAAVAQGAEEVGLLRTEFLFIDRDDVPAEDEQAGQLHDILAALDGRAAVVRTLDVGGDKHAPALGLDPRRNGFLGRRGLRWALAHPEVFRPHLRAILRAGAGRRIRVMFPFVTTAAEISAARSALAEAEAALAAEGVPHGAPEQVGIMLEIPGAALRAAELAPTVDFFSIGSNDLVQYLTAADRTLAEVADLATPANAALLDVVRGVTEAARRAGVWTGVCGEAAADPELAAQLVAAGVDELSMGPAAIPEVKHRLRAEG